MLHWRQPYCSKWYQVVFTSCTTAQTSKSYVCLRWWWQQLTGEFCQSNWFITHSYISLQKLSIETVTGLKCLKCSFETMESNYKNEFVHKCHMYKHIKYNHALKEDNDSKQSKVIKSDTSVFREASEVVLTSNLCCLGA